MSFRKRLIILFIALWVLLSSLASIVYFFSDWLFFEETGFGSVFTTTLWAKLASAGCFGLVLLLFIAINLKVAFQQQFFPRSTLFPGGTWKAREQAVQFVKPISLAVGLVLALLAAKWGMSQWQSALLFLNALELGTTDPIMGIDLGFYLFQMPLVEMVRGFVVFALVSTLALLGAVYFVKGGISLIDPGRALVDPRVRRHAAILVALLGLAWGLGFFLEGLGLLFSGKGTVFGVSYADVHGRLFSYQLLGILTPLAGVVLAVGIWQWRLRLVLIPVVAVAAVYGLGVVVYPEVLQKFKVAPNELDLETPYINNAIKFTRLGYDLEKIQTIPFDVDQKLTGSDIVRNDATIKNIRLWDHEPLLKTFSQLQQIRTYYRFHDVDNDRYLVNGQYTQVMLSPRELSYDDLPSRNWINEHLIFTHGNGLTLGPVSRISKEGLPEFYIKDIPPVSLADVKVTRPEIYYGEMSNDYVLVKTKVPEFSYPTATGNISTTYRGKGGVPIDSALKKSLFAIRFQTEKILLSSDITRQSRILYYRNINDRVRAIAPFLRFDGDPYLMIADDGTQKWIIDGYTYSTRLPYSKPLRGGINYMRNSVKAVIDAYDGSVTFYVSDPSDVIARVYSRIFPGLLQPMSKMPKDVRRHIRYPHQFLQVQAAMFAAYHMTDPKVFYNKENLWEIPALGEKPMEPYYTIMKLPGEAKEEYLLLLPFTPSKRDNLAAWLTARCDGDSYGKLLAYTFPRDRLIYGPKQIDARINQDSFISQQLTLWNQRGSEVIRGSMLVIPIERSLLYVQPLFLAAADKSGLPELRRVIVAFGDQVVMEETLELALQRIFGGTRAAAAVAPAASAGTVKGAAAPTGGSTSQLAKEAMSAFEKALTLQRQGDWAGYGEQLKQLQQILRRMAQ